MFTLQNLSKNSILSALARHKDPDGCVRGTFLELAQWVGPPMDLDRAHDILNQLNAAGYFSTYQAHSLGFDGSFFLKL